MLNRSRVAFFVFASGLSASVAPCALAAPLTLTGDYLQVGISDYGTFGSDGPTSPGLLHDPSGAGNFSPNGTPNDYLTPGTPHDGFAIHSTETGFLVNDNTGSGPIHDSPDFGTAAPTILTGRAAKGYDNAATWSGSYGTDGGPMLTVDNSYYFNRGDDKIRVVTTITALTNLTHLAFGRSEDPDPDVNAFGTHQTTNTRGDSTTAPQDLVSAAGPRTGLTIGIHDQSGDAYAHNTAVSLGCCSNSDPYLVLADAADAGSAASDGLTYPVYSATNFGDYGLQIAWDLGNLTEGESATIEYDYVFGSNQPHVVIPLPTINTREGDIQPNIFSLGSPAAVAELVDFEGGILRLTGGDFPGNVIPTSVKLGFPNGTVDTNRVSGGFSGLVFGAGSLTVIGGGVFSLTHANVYEGGTFVTSSTVAVGNDAALGTGIVTLNRGTLRPIVDNLTLANAVALIDNGTIDTQAFLLTFTGSFTGEGHLTKVGKGVLALLGSSSYSGDTRLNQGTLAVGVNNALGSGRLLMRSGTALAFAADGLVLPNDIVLAPVGDPTVDTGPNDATIAGAITGAGELSKVGTGALDLTGASTYAGGTTVAQGTLLVDGSITSNATVENGARLGGSGTIGGLDLLDGATLAPGFRQSFAKLTVTGDATFRNGSTFAVNINDAGLNSAVVINGAAAILGGTVAVGVAPGSYSSGSHYTILTANAGRTGSFSALTMSTDLAFLTPALSYDADHAYLGFTRAAAFGSVATTPNQQATAGGIESLGPTNPLYGAVLSQSPAGAQQAFTSASGQPLASAPTVAVGSTHYISQTVIDRLWNIPVTGGDDALSVLSQFGPTTSPTLLRCYAPDEDRGAVASNYTVWGQGVGDFGRNGGDGNAQSVDRKLGGFSFGIDSRVNATFFDNWRVGVGGGYTNTSFSVSNGGGQGTFENVFGTIYGGVRYGVVDVRLGASYGGTSTSSHRTVAFPGFSEAERASYGGDTAQGFGEIGYRFAFPRTVLEPVLGGSIIHVHQDGFREKGGVAALVGTAQDTDVGTTTLGVRGEVTPFGGLPLVARAFLGWQHSYGDINPASTLAFASGSASFSIYGTPLDRDAAVGEAAVGWRATEALSMTLGYNGQIGPRDHDNAVKGRVDYRF